MKEPLKIDPTYFKIFVAVVARFVVHERHRSGGDVNLSPVIDYGGSKDDQWNDSMFFIGVVIADRFVHQFLSDLIQLIFERVGSVFLIPNARILIFCKTYEKIIGKKAE